MTDAAAEAIRLALSTTRRPWSQLFNPSRISLPQSLTSTQHCLKHNLTYFIFNYTCLIFTAIFLFLLPHPLSLLTFFATLALWVFLYFTREDPLVVFGFNVEDWVLVAGLCVVSVVGLWFGMSGAGWLGVVLGFCVGGGVVCLHACLRETEDLVDGDGDDTAYGSLLSEVGAS